MQVQLCWTRHLRNTSNPIWMPLRLVYYPPKMIAAPRTSPAMVIAQITTVYFAANVSIFAFWFSSILDSCAFCFFSMLDSCAVWVSIFAFWFFSMLDSCAVSISILAPNWLTRFVDAMASISSISSWVSSADCFPSSASLRRSEKTRVASGYDSSISSFRIRLRNQI